MIHYLSLCRHPDTLLRPLHNWTSFNSPSRHSLHSHSGSANDFASHATLSCHCTEDNIYSECGLHQAKNLLPLCRRLLGQGNEIVTLGFNLLLHEGGRHFPCTTLPTPPLPFSGSFMVFIEKRDIATRCLGIMSRRLKLDIRIKSEIGGEGGAVGSSVQTEKE